MTAKPETREFKIHPQLLFDVIQRQAGTLTKALCEGVMNSIDAGATKVEVTLTDKRASIADDGRGFPTRESIELFFETFGQPHQEGDAVYGTFRMGRGQMFSFGVNRWRSGRFAMKVDIKGRGLDYDLTEGGEDAAGCAIDIALYKPLSLLQQREIGDDLRRMVRYVAVPVLLNGEQINKVASSERWDFEDEFAFYKLGQGRLSIYNLGIFVNDHKAYNLGIGGTVVAKQQLRLNFARNDVLSDCKVWQRIAKVLRSKADTNIREKRGALSAEERALLAQRLRSGDLGNAERRDAAVFQDAAGRWLTIDKLARAISTGNHTLTAGPKSPRGEKVQRAHMALVLNEAHLDEFFRVDTVEELVAKVIRPNAGWLPTFRIVPFSTLISDDESERCEIIPPQSYTPAEAVVIEVLNGLRAPDFSRQRKIVLGESDSFNGWTDGRSYIAIDRKFLKGRDIGSPATWTAIALLLCHEYSHGGPSSATHDHGPEFHEQYHDGSRTAVPQWVSESVKLVRGAVERVNERVGKNALRWLDMIDEAAKTNGSLDEVLIAAREKHARPAPAPLLIAADAPRSRLRFVRMEEDMPKKTKVKAKPAPKPRAKGGSYADILTAQGYARVTEMVSAGWQRWEKGADHCVIDTKNGAWTLTREGGEAKGRLTPSLAKVFA
jgi:hypothetical protein